MKLCKDCELVDDVFTQTDSDLIFAKVVTKGHRRITLHQFELALRMMAQKKGVEEDEIFRRVAESEGVLHAGTQADYVRFFDDKSTYTGTHLYGGRPQSAMLSMKLWKYQLVAGRIRSRQILCLFLLVFQSLPGWFAVAFSRLRSKMRQVLTIPREAVSINFGVPTYDQRENQMIAYQKLGREAFTVWT